MFSSAFSWLVFNLISLAFLAFYSMMEMACVSFNKVRLHYYVHKGNKHAKWLNDLLQHPFKLFGTTLIMVNLSMFVGSECAREFHHALGVDPDLAPVTQVLLVVIFGELAPMFAARHYAEHVTMLGIPVVYASAKLLTPVLWIIGWITKAANFFTRGKPTETPIFLNQEELQKILEETGEPTFSGEEQNLNAITRNIFGLRNKIAKEIRSPLDAVPRLPSNASISQMKEEIKRTDADFVLVYYKERSNIVAIAFPRDLIRLPDNKRVRDAAKAPWFVTENTPLTQILKEFQKNTQNVAIILDSKGLAQGFLTLEDLIEEIFGEAKEPLSGEKQAFFMTKTFPGHLTVGEFNEMFHLTLHPDQTLNLSELMKQTLGRYPEKGESIHVASLELIAKEVSLTGVSSVTVKSRSEGF